MRPAGRMPGSSYALARSWLCSQLNDLLLLGHRAPGLTELCGGRGGQRCWPGFATGPRWGDSCPDGAVHGESELHGGCPCALTLEPCVCLYYSACSTALAYVARSGMAVSNAQTRRAHLGTREPGLLLGAITVTQAPSGGSYLERLSEW